jgi:glycosidase
MTLRVGCLVSCVLLVSAVGACGGDDVVPPEIDAGAPRVDAGSDAGLDAGRDASEPATDAGFDAGADANVPVMDAGFDAGADGSEPATDAGLDAGADASVSLGDAGSDAAVTPVDEWRNAVMYFAVVDRFVDGNAANNGAAVASVASSANYQGGDFAGLRQKIESGYFTDIGVNALWVSVPMDNAVGAGLGADGHLYSAYAGYWPRNLDTTESRFGTMMELKAMVDAAHARGIRIVLDYTMNHVHQESPVYAAHPDWFWPRDFAGSPCLCGSLCAWDGPQATRCWVADYLPDFDFTNIDARRFSVDNVIWWLQQTGADGLRLDHIKSIEDVWLTDLRARLGTDIEPSTGRHVFVVGETFTGDRAVIGSVVDPTRLDGQLDLPLRAQLITAVLLRTTPMSELAPFLESNDSYYGPSALMTTLVGHDMGPRAIHFGEDTPIWSDPWATGADRAWSGQPALPSGTAAFERLANAFTLLFTMKGVPLIYYGDEVGMAGGGAPDNQRMMQWTGYSAGQSLLLAHVQRLGQLRATLPALSVGTRTTLSATADTLAYELRTPTQTVSVAINRSDVAQSVTSLPSGSLSDLLSGATVLGPAVSVPARTAMIFAAP